MRNFLLTFCLSLFVFSSLAQEKMEVFFDFNKYDLNPVALTTLNDWMLNNPAIKVSKIYGFCDWKGTNSYNDTLSLQSVQTVFDYLTEHKIEIEQDYAIKGFGKDFTQDKIQALNRKVEIFYVNQVLKIVEQKKSNEEAYIPEIKNEITLTEQIKTAQVGDKIIVRNINFYSKTAKIVPKSKQVVVELLAVLKENPNLKIQIQGHICCQTGHKYDRTAKERAMAIYNFLKSNAIKPNRISYKSFGSRKPIYPIPEKSEEERAANRRVEILIVEN